MSSPAASADHPEADRGAAPEVLAWLIGLSIVLPFEVERIWSTWLKTGRPQSILFDWNSDTTLPAVLLLIAPPVWIWGKRRAVRFPLSATTGRGKTIGLLAVVLFCASASLLISVWVGTDFGALPPAYHDEFSYLFQAKTFVAGRLWYPSHPARELFDQIHVLNEGKFASRYFPGTALWMAPFVAVGNPWLGQWIAGAVATALVVLIAAELSSLRAGAVAGALTALSPGLALFSNLLLAHHPTLVGLLAFVLGFVRWLRTGRVRDAALAGVGLTFAMWCRPLTAAATAFPFGILTGGIALFGRPAYFSVERFVLDSTNNDRRMVRNDSPTVSGGIGVNRWSPRLTVVGGLGIPLLAGLLLLGLYNREITGNVFKSPWQQYNELYTPQHGFGFNNVERGRALRGTRTMQQYDDWAENLTWPLACQHAGERLIASGQWTLGLVLLAMTLVWLLCDLPRFARMFTGPSLPLSMAGDLSLSQQMGVFLVLASIVSLHVFHIPYWFVGIMHWHYVFESAPLWLILVGVVTDRVLRQWQSRPWRSVLWMALLAAAPLVNLTTLPGFWQSRLAAGIAEVRYSRQKYSHFERLVNQSVTRRPAIIIVHPDPSDRHVDYVTNPASLDSPILFARALPDMNDNQLRDLFPDRTLYHYDARTNRLRGPGIMPPLR